MSKKINLNIELYLLCFNEERMILHTLNYYSKICSRIIVMDNHSTDNSIDLASKFDNVEIRSLDSGEEFIEDRLNDSRNNCWKGSTADYVIVCDMDEFLYDENLVDKLHRAKEQNVIIPTVMGYNMISEDFPTDYNRSITEQVTQGMRTYRFDKNIIFDPKRLKEINYSPGAHLCSPVFYDDTAIDSLIEFKLLHYKYLGRNYLYEKHEGYVQRMSEISREKEHGVEYLDGKEHINKIFDSANHLYEVVA